MADKKNSIFDFEKVFSIESPLGNWISPLKKELFVQFKTAKLKSSTYTITLHIHANNLSSYFSIITLYQYSILGDKKIQSKNVYLKNIKNNEYNFVIDQSTSPLIKYVEGEEYNFLVECDGLSFETDNFSLKAFDDSEYFAQEILTPQNKLNYIHKDAIAIVNEMGQVISFVTPDQKIFQWVSKNGFGYFENGDISFHHDYGEYVYDKQQRLVSPISWGIELAINDSVEGAIQLLTSVQNDPIGTIGNFALILKKIALLDFDISKTWEKFINSDRTDVAYAAGSLFFAYLAGPKKLNLIKENEIVQFSEFLNESKDEVVEEVVEKSTKNLAKNTSIKVIRKLTWPEILELFSKWINFQKKVSLELIKKYPIIDGWIHAKNIYLKVDNVVSIADDLLYNSKSPRIILNESKFGVTNNLRNNQKSIHNAIKAGKSLEIRSHSDILEENGLNLYFSQGDKIEINEILRSHSVDGDIINETIKSEWKK